MDPDPTRSDHITSHHITDEREICDGTRRITDPIPSPISHPSFYSHLMLSTPSPSLPGFRPLTSIPSIISHQSACGGMGEWRKVTDEKKLSASQTLLTESCAPIPSPAPALSLPGRPGLGHPAWHACMHAAVHQALPPLPSPLPQCGMCAALAVNSFPL